MSRLGCKLKLLLETDFTFRGVLSGKNSVKTITPGFYVEIFETKSSSNDQLVALAQKVCTKLVFGEFSEKKQVSIYEENWLPKVQSGTSQVILTQLKDYTSHYKVSTPASELTKHTSLFTLR